MPKQLTPMERRADAMSELDLERMVIELAERYGWWVYSVRRSDKARPNGRTHQGYPDLTMVHNGLISFAELKTRAGKPTDAQQAWLDKLRTTFSKVYLWTPMQWLDGTIERELRPLSHAPAPNPTPPMGDVA